MTKLPFQMSAKERRKNRFEGLGATGGQKRYIAVLCMQCGIREEIEQKEMSFGEAGRMIRELEGMRRALRRKNNLSRY